VKEKISSPLKSSSSDDENLSSPSAKAMTWQLGQKAKVRDLTKAFTHHLHNNRHKPVRCCSPAH
jgi:hypothetical protein